MLFHPPTCLRPPKAAMFRVSTMKALPAPHLNGSRRHRLAVTQLPPCQTGGGIIEAYYTVFRNSNQDKTVLTLIDADLCADAR